jgi:hypothetical protein
MPAIFPLLTALILLLILSFNKEASPVDSCRLMAISKVGRIAALLESSIQRIEKNDRLLYKELLPEYDSAMSCYASIEFFVEYYSAFDAANYINPGNISDPGMAGFRCIQAQLQSRSANINKLLKDYRLLNARFRDLQRTYDEIEINQPQMLAALNLQLQRMRRFEISGDGKVDNAEQKLYMSALSGISEVMNYLASDAYYSLLLEESNTRLKECINKIARLKGMTVSASYFYSEMIDPVIEQMAHMETPEL